MRTPLLPALALGGLLAACDHSKAWDDAWAGCEATAMEQAEYADVDPDQRTLFRERYIGSCMQRQGFHDPQYLFGGQQSGRN